jgi:hypothetical protein
MHLTFVSRELGFRRMSAEDELMMINNGRQRGRLTQMLRQLTRY